MSPRTCLPLVTVLLTLARASLHAAEADQAAAQDLLLRLRAGRGLSGPPVATATAPALPADPRARELGARLAARQAGTAASTTAARAARPAALPAPAGDRQQAAWQRLRQAAGPGLEIHWRPENGTVRQIRGGVLARRAAGATGADPRTLDESTARAFLGAQRELFRIEDGEREWSLERSQPDGLGGRTVRFAQRYRNLPVWPAALSVHLDRDGNVVLVEGAYVPTPAGLATDPTIPAPDATLRAKASVPGGMRGEAGTPELVVFAPLEYEPRLAWRLELNVGLTQAWTLLVDAQTGAILRRSNRILDANVVGRGVDLAGRTQSLNVWEAGGVHYLIDTSKPMYKPGGNPIDKPEGAITIVDARNKKANELRGSDLFLITSPNPSQWAIPDGVSAAYNFSRTYDYFLSQQARNSLDGQGGNITAIVRVAEYDNASWNGNLKVMLFGNVKPYAEALDVVGHELTHGLTESSAGLVYEVQPGALNESFSDIFGEMVEAFVEGQPDWKMGTRLGKVFRDFKDPGSLTIGGLNRPYPAKMSQFIRLPNDDDNDHGGVHLNSSIINHCFWLLAEGLPGAIGRRDAERIFFRCLAQHLLPQSQFIDTRLGCQAAAEALFGADSAQARKVAEAFDAVEIFAAPQTPAPTPIPVVQAPDSVFFITEDPTPILGGLLVGRRETAQGDPDGGVLFTDSTRLSRPAVTGNGEEIALVNALNDLCIAPTADARQGDCLGYAGTVHAVALSPDGRWAAFVFLDPGTGQPDNRINLIHLETGDARAIELLAPALDGVPVDGVLHADSMVFSSDSSVLIYDALSALRFGNGPRVERWSIFALNIETSKISIVVPPIEGVDTGNPSMGRAGNRYLVFDALVEATGNSLIVVEDLFTGAANQVGLVERGLGYPAFTGDETAVIHAARDTAQAAPWTGFSLVRQPLQADRLGAQGNAERWVADAKLGVVYRRGAYQGANQLPTVTVTAPGAGAALVAGTPLALTATATDPDGNVAKVEFYDGDLRLGEDTTSPYSMPWTPVGVGAHRLIARATDNLGGVRDSAAVSVTVTDPGSNQRPEIALAVRPGGVLRLTLRGTAGNYLLQRSTNLVQWTDLAPVTVGATGEGFVDDDPVGTADAVRFYRAVRP